MNIVRELRKKKGVQQKELAIAIGVSCPTVSAWESNKKDPSGERLQKLAKYFGVDELVILGKGTFVPDQPGLFVPINPEINGQSETDQIIERLFKQLDSQPRTKEARIISDALDRMPPADREKVLNMLKAVYSEYFPERKGELA